MSRSKKRSRAAPGVTGKPFFADQAKDDLTWWRQPFTGIGKPEPLTYGWPGYWSRRITEEHRLVYRVEAGQLYILQLRYHYR